jgi:tetratricopeptide (TPR) repeat protein
MKFMTIEEIFMRVNNAMRIGEYTLAEELLHKVTEKKPDFYIPFLWLGNVYERTGRIDKALESYKRSIHLKPDNVEAFNNCGVVYKNTKKYKEALAFLNRAALLAPDRGDICYNIGNVYKETENFDLAIHHYEKAIEIKPDFVPAYNNLGMVLEKLGHYDLAEQVYTLGLEVDPNNPKLHYNLGIIYERQDQLQKARREFEHALRAKPGFHDALLNLGIVLSRLSEHNKSIDALQSLLALDPGHVKAVNNLGIEYSKLKDLEKAKSFYQQAINMKPDYDKPRFNLGILLENQGEYKQALQEIENLLKVNPDNLAARFRMGTIYTAMGKYRKAEDQFRSILKKQPEDSETVRALGNLYLRAGKYHEANKWYKRLSEINPEMGDYHLDFAVLLNDKKEFEKSEAEVKKFLSSHPDDIHATSLLGELYYKQNLYKNASGLFEQMIEKNPHISSSYYHLAETYKKMGEPEKAIETIDKLITLQGNRGTPTAIGDLNKTLALYEKEAKEYEKKFKVRLNKKIAHLDDFSYDDIGELPIQDDPDLIYQGDETETIIKTGGIEPVIPVKEEVEQIKIIESGEEDSLSGVVEIEDSEPLPFIELLKNQDLYASLPALTAQLKKQQDDALVQGKDKTNQDVKNEFKKNTIPSRKKGEGGQEIPPDFNQKESGVPPYQPFQDKKIQKKPGEIIPPGLLQSMSDKIDLIADKTQETTEPGKTTMNDKTNETLINVLENISRALKEGITPGTSPSLYIPLQGQRHPPQKKQHKQESLDEYLENKAKTTREKLKEFFQNIRKKLDEKEDIALPGDKKKQQYIHDLVKRLSPSNPFKENLAQLAAEKTENKKNRRITDLINSLKEGYNKELKTDEKPEIESIEKACEKLEVTAIEKVDEYRGDKNRDEDDLTSMDQKAPGKKGETHHDHGGELKYPGDPGEEKADKTDVYITAVNNWETQYDESGGSLPVETLKEDNKEKSFKPSIRLEEKSSSGSLMLKTLQFLRRLLGFIPDIGLKTGIKTKLDDAIKKLKRT